MTARPDDMDDLARLSARIGADPLLIQAAGGNTSVKDGQVMWIKASGTLLAEAETRDIFVACDLPAMRDSLQKGEDRADRPMEFALAQDGLRPSIETSLHAVFPQRVVLHAHCIHTLVHAVQADPVAAIGTKLGGFDWGIVPYAKPGADLAMLVRDEVEKGRDVIILGNHGVIVAADTVAAADDLLHRVSAALRMDAVPLQAATLGDLPAGWMVGPASLSHVAGDPALLSMATGGSLYPDHVIFCGVGALACDMPPEGDSPPFVLIPGKGAAMRADATSGAWALARCLGDVLTRVPEGAALNYLTLAQNGALLDWDAEKYRQALNG
ncbi:class II aldolase/adducin family protein [Oceaniglobus indicus]|uniref:class II aldolase/adducin family protein n=1 Tax=Oceaniglobus indicus TaxID=2047749 RepID=UPI000C173C4D|nr:class II aldolase/adducin family protein [Oceaniglobus indicus]